MQEDIIGSYKELGRRVTIPTICFTITQAFSLRDLLYSTLGVALGFYSSGRCPETVSRPKA